VVIHSRLFPQVNAGGAGVAPIADLP